MKKYFYILLLIAIICSCDKNSETERLTKEIELRISEIETCYNWDYSFGKYNHQIIDSLLSKIERLTLNEMKISKADYQIIKDLFTSNEIRINEYSSNQNDCFLNLLIALDHLIFRLAAIRADRMVYKPIVVAKKEIIHPGEIYEAKILLAARDKFNEPQFRVYQINSTKIDSTTQLINSDNWQGEFKYSGRKKEDKNVHGSVSIVYPNGEEEIIPWELEFKIE